MIQDMCYLTAGLHDNGLLEKYASDRILQWHHKHLQRDTDRVRRQIFNAMLANKPLTAEDLIRAAEAEHPVSAWHKRWFQEQVSFCLHKYQVTVQAVEARHREALADYQELSPEKRKRLGLSNEPPKQEEITCDLLMDHQKEIHLDTEFEE